MIKTEASIAIDVCECTFQGGQSNASSKNAVNNTQSSSMPNPVRCGQPTALGIDWTRRENATLRDQRNSSSSTNTHVQGQLSQVLADSDTAFIPLGGDGDDVDRPPRSLLSRVVSQLALYAGFVFSIIA